MCVCVCGPGDGVYVIEDLSTSFHKGYDAPPGSSNTTYNVMREFNRTRRMKSKHLSPAERCYLERWISSAEVKMTRRATNSHLCIVRKAAEPRPRRVCRDGSDSW